MSALEVRRIRADEWAKLRDVRLRALAEAPTAFASRLEDEAARTESAWAERAARGAAGDRSATFVAEDAGGFVALAGGYVDDEDAGVHLVAMWVDPAWRGRRIGRALTEAVIEWARSRGEREVHLWVTETNAAAIRLYEACGFRWTGRAERLPSAPSLLARFMSRPL